MKDDLIRLVKELALTVAPPGRPFKLRSGATSPYYLDCRKLTLSRRGLREVLSCLSTVLPPSAIVGGPCVGADPVVGGALALGLAERGFLVRPEAKGHGLGGRIVGDLRPGDRVVLIDDVATLGGSLLDAVQAVRAAGAEVAMALAIVDRLAGADALLNAHGVPFRPLLTVEDLGVTP